jgi:pimeloyl-ACP methyl ester carboxylesterase
MRRAPELPDHLAMATLQRAAAGTPRDEPTPSHRAGDGEPLVLLHGINLSWRVWRPLFDPLAERHDVFAPTLPGHRGGPPLDPDRPASIEALCDGVERSLDAAGLERAHIAGNSLGGWIAIELARRGRALSVVAFSPVGGWTSDRDLRRVIALLSGARMLLSQRKSLRLERLMRRPRFRRLAFRQGMVRGDLIPAEEVAELVDDMMDCDAYDSFVRWIRRAQPVQGFDGGLPCPVRIAWAEHDRTIPFDRFGRPLLDALGEAEFVTVAGVGHMPMYDDSALVAETILEVTNPRTRTGATQ